MYLRHPVSKIVIEMTFENYLTGNKTRYSAGGGRNCREVGMPVICACSTCSVLQCVAVCCSVLQCVAVCCSVLQCVAVRSST